MDRFAARSRCSLKSADLKQQILKTPKGSPTRSFSARRDEILGPGLGCGLRFTFCFSMWSSFYECTECSGQKKSRPKVFFEKIETLAHRNESTVFMVDRKQIFVDRKFL